MNKAVIIDRDGTLSIDVHYCCHPKDFLMFPDSAEAVKKLNDAGFKVVVITNQSAIGRGYTTHTMVNRIHDKMRRELSRVGAHIDAIYYCPHNPAESCECRKPGDKLARHAARDLNLDLKKSWVVGDMWLDIEMGKKIGARTIQVRNLAKSTPEPDYYAQGLKEAVEIICNHQ